MTSTASRTTRVLGIAALAGVVVLVLFAFVLTDPDAIQGDMVRMFYIHVPVIITAYLCFALTAIGSIAYLWKRSEWWDLVAVSAAEVGVLFTGLGLLTGAIWGRPTWGTYFEWGDVRFVTTLVLLLLYLGYLALRRVPGDPHVRAKQGAVVALVAFADIPIINRSVEWWQNRTLHQTTTLATGKIDGLKLFTLAMAFVVFAAVVAWMLVHRFRIAWLERQIDAHSLDSALADRRAEGRAGLDRALGRAGMETS